MSPSTANEPKVIFTFIPERYERRSLGIMSSLVFSERERIFANPMATRGAPINPLSSVSGCPK